MSLSVICTNYLILSNFFQHVKYVRGDLRMFQAMKNLEYTPLQYSVISPMAASEDFTLPDVSQKNLAFSVRRETCLFLVVFCS